MSFTFIMFNVVFVLVEWFFTFMSAVRFGILSTMPFYIKPAVLSIAKYTPTWPFRVSMPTCIVSWLCWSVMWQ